MLALVDRAEFTSFRVERLPLQPVDAVAALGEAGRAN
jgi:hypothetical protein